VVLDQIVPERNLDCPIQTLSLSVGFRMKEGTQAKLRLEGLEHMFPELWGELEDGVRKCMEARNVLDKQVCCLMESNPEPFGRHVIESQYGVSKWIHKASKHFWLSSVQV